MGKFHTPPELVATIAALAETQLITPPRNIYDPTCGAGDLLSAFPGIPKYGQDIDESAMKDAVKNLDNFHPHVGDVLKEPAWMGKKFHLIVANPPFSIKWEPKMDERFEEAPTIPTQSRADYAFNLHVIHMLEDDGVGVVMNFPGILYRSGREQKIRQWMVEQNLISHIVHIPGGKFEDTTIATCILIYQKCRDRVGIQFIDLEHDIERFVDRLEIAANDYNLSVSQYLAPDIPEPDPVDPWKLQECARADFLKQMEKEIALDAMICRLEGWDHSSYLDEISDFVNSRKLREAA